MPDDTALPMMRQRPTLTSRQILPRPTDTGQKPVRSLYVHVPFCAHKCHYCDFYSFVDTRDRQRAFVDRLGREFDATAPLAGPLDTVFIGGGTPTLLEAAPLAAMLGAMHAAFEIDPATAEVTIECNPETASGELMRVLVDHGVNRISIGAQSFDPRHLVTLERRHEPANVERAVEFAADAGIPHRSIDLIYAIPGQTPADLDDDLDRAFALPIDHVSAYALTYEPNTAMTKRLERGDFKPAGDSLEADMFEQVRARVRAAGLTPYETSNFAKPGGECRHNLAYWRQEQWLAIGPSASGHVGGHRYKNVPRLDDYLSVDDEGFALVVDHEAPDAARLLAERVMTGLRLSEGIDGEQIAGSVEELDPESGAALRATAADAVGRGLLAVDNGRWILTERGVLLADGIAADLMAAIR